MSRAARQKETTTVTTKPTAAQRRAQRHAELAAKSAARFQEETIALVTAAIGDDSSIAIDRHFERFHYEMDLWKRGLTTGRAAPCVDEARKAAIVRPKERRRGKAA
jgi:hypothetical protein